MNNTLQNSKPFRMGLRYFRKHNFLAYKPEDFIGSIFVAIDTYSIYMYEAIELNRGTTFPFKLKILKVYDRRTQIWKKPVRIITDVIEVGPVWFTKRATFIQCDEQGN